MKVCNEDQQNLIFDETTMVNIYIIYIKCCKI